MLYCYKNANQAADVFQHILTLRETKRAVIKIFKLNWALWRCIQLQIELLEV